MAERFELLYNDLKTSYEDLEQHKNELVSMKDQQITKYKNNILKLEIENENIKESLECKEKEISGLVRQCADANKKRTECEGIQVSLEKEMEEIKMKWKHIDLKDFPNAAQKDKENIQKYILTNGMSDEIYQQKIKCLEEALKNSQAQLEVALQRLKNQQQSNKQSEWFFSRWFFKKSSNEISQVVNLNSKMNSSFENQNNFTKLLTVHNREKEILLRKTKKYKDEIQTLENELKRKENDCIALKKYIDELKRDLKVKKEETREIEVLKQENLEIKKLQATLRNKTESLDNSKVELENKSKEIENLKRILNEERLKYEQFYAKKLNLEEYIKDLEERLNQTPKPIKPSIFDHYAPIADTTFADNSLGKSNIELESNEKTVLCANCDKMMPQSQIETHFAKCIFDE